MRTDTRENINDKVTRAGNAFAVFRKTPAKVRALLLQAIAQKIHDNRIDLAVLAQSETSLAPDRLDAEITRTVNQCYLFADLLLEGSWVRAIIDSADGARTPAPKPDLRQMQVPLGPVAVFGASNFPFAYSVCGGDTAAALAAGCPIVYKVNPGHPHTSQRVADIVQQAITAHSLPYGLFDIVNGAGSEPGLQLVMHPAIKAVGFTGSLAGGRALFNAAATREEPIPVYAEMGSTNPVFILPGILKEKGNVIAATLSESNNASAGQFCTNPGIMISLDGDDRKEFLQTFVDRVSATPPSAMLNENIRKSFNKIIDKVSGKHNVSILTNASADKELTGAFVFETTSRQFLSDHELFEEMFGPASLQVKAESTADLVAIARAMPGQITASVWGTDEDLLEHHELVSLLQMKAGRIIINGVPTGVEVTHAMNHGGPYPATTDSKFTSVGTQSIYRFTRPVCFQNFPQNMLPDELKDDNPLKILRMINGQWQR